MARVVKEKEYSARREEILDVGLSLVRDKGYEQMTIQDILDGLGISRGAFYHYFDSKQALLEALVERMGRQEEQALLPIVQDPHLTAAQKIGRCFEISAGLKGAQKGQVPSELRLWHGDENALVHLKMIRYLLRHTPARLEPIIRQGVAEKVFSTSSPEEAAVIIGGLALNLSESVIESLLAPGPESRPKVASLLDAYVESVERILGAPAGSLKVFTVDDFKEWGNTSNKDQ